jgi:hypothetical protein
VLLVPSFAITPPPICVEQTEKQVALVTGGDRLIEKSVLLVVEHNTALRDDRHVRERRRGTKRDGGCDRTREAAKTDCEIGVWVLHVKRSTVFRFCAGEP